MRIALHQIESDGRTVWVNNQEGICLGRFSRFGIDIHGDLRSQLDGMHCLDCKPTHSVHDWATLQDWERFKEGMLRFHNVDVPDSHRPKYLLSIDKATL